MAMFRVPTGSLLVVFTDLERNPTVRGQKPGIVGTCKSFATKTGSASSRDFHCGELVSNGSTIRINKWQGGELKLVELTNDNGRLVEGLCGNINVAIPQTATKRV